MRAFETPQCDCGCRVADYAMAMRAGWVFKRGSFAGPRKWVCSWCWRKR